MLNQKQSSAVRADLTAKLLDALRAIVGEDVDYIASGTLNFPIVHEGVEAWAEVKISIPKTDDLDDGYLKREDYKMRLVASAEKAEARKAKAEAKKAEAEAKKAKAKTEKGE